MRLGPCEVSTVIDGTFLLDGGAMFGIVPRAVWERTDHPDLKNRIALAMRCLLIRVDGRTILVDTGIGEKWAPQELERFGVSDRSSSLRAALAVQGLTPEDITDVILTHLHFDHAGGVTRKNALGRLELSFPRARHYLQRRNLAHALHPTVRDRGSYLEENFAPLLASKQLHLLDGPTELAPGVDVLLYEGHTVAQQLVRLRDPRDRRRWLIYGADIIPTSSHLGAAFVMGYDLMPDVTAREKTRLLARAADDEGIVVFEHDRDIAACTVELDGQGRPKLKGPIEL